MAVPSWPLDAGHLIPQQWGAGVLFEWGHRVIAGTVSILTLTLALWVWMAERRAWVRYTALAAFAMVVVQAVLGGITVLLGSAPGARGRTRDDRAGILLPDGRDRVVHEPALADDGARCVRARPIALGAAGGRDHGNHLICR